VKDYKRPEGLHNRGSSAIQFAEEYTRRLASTNLVLLLLPVRHPTESIRIVSVENNCSLHVVFLVPVLDGGVVVGEEKQLDVLWMSKTR